MTQNQERFIAEYIIDRNATRAYRAAYPGAHSESAIRANASRLIAKANIREAIEQAQAEALHKAGVQAEDVIREIAAIAYSDSEKPATVRDRLEALRLLGEYLHLFQPVDKSAREISVIFAGGDGLAE